MFAVSKFKYIFRFKDSLLYSKDNEGIKRLVVPFSLIQRFLRDVYKDKHHFGKDCMIQKLDRLYFRNKTQKVYIYIKRCYNCGMNRINNQLFLKSFQPIQILLQPMYTITFDFVITFLIVVSKNTLWAIEGYDIFDIIFATICKTSKKKLFLPGNKRYSAKD